MSFETTTSPYFLLASETRFVSDNAQFSSCQNGIAFLLYSLHAPIGFMIFGAFSELITLNVFNFSHLFIY